MDGSSKPVEALARSAAVEAGIADLWDRLRGDTPEELRADAEKLAYMADHPPDQATLDKQRREAAERIAESEAQVAEAEAEIARLDARIAEITTRRRKERERFDARIAENHARIAALRAEIRERMAARPGSAPRAREQRPRRTRAGGSRSQGDPSRSADDDDPAEPVAPGGRR